MEIDSTMKKRPRLWPPCRTSPLRMIFPSEEFSQPFDDFERILIINLSPNSVRLGFSPLIGLTFSDLLTSIDSSLFLFFCVTNCSLVG